MQKREQSLADAALEFRKSRRTSQETIDGRGYN